MHHLGRLLCLLAAFAVIEGPYFMLQSYAWITMLQDRTPKMGFENALVDTFSGDHPCEKCLALEEERQNQSQKNPVPETRQQLKLAPVPSLSPPLLASWGRLSSLPWADVPSSGCTRSDEVPSPPPRTV